MRRDTWSSDTTYGWVLKHMTGAQGRTQILHGTRIALQNEIIGEQPYETHGYQMMRTTTQPRVSYPRMHIAQPLIPDETGYMSFRFIARMSAETHVRMHLLPDHTGLTTPEHWCRQTLMMSVVYNDKEDVKTFDIPCIPYEISNV